MSDDEAQDDWTDQEAQALANALPRGPMKALHLLVTMTAAVAVEIDVDLPDLLTALQQAYEDHEAVADDDGQDVGRLN